MTLIGFYIVPELSMILRQTGFYIVRKTQSLWDKWIDSIFFKKLLIIITEIGFYIALKTLDHLEVNE